MIIPQEIEMNNSNFNIINSNQENTTSMNSMPPPTTRKTSSTTSLTPATATTTLNTTTGAASSSSGNAVRSWRDRHRSEMDAAATDAAVAIIVLMVSLSLESSLRVAKSLQCDNLNGLNATISAVLSAQENPLLDDEDDIEEDE